MVQLWYQRKFVYCVYKYLNMKIFVILYQSIMVSIWTNSRINIFFIKQLYIWRNFWIYMYKRNLIYVEYMDIYSSHSILYFLVLWKQYEHHLCQHYHLYHHHHHHRNAGNWLRSRLFSIWPRWTCYVCPDGAVWREIEIFSQMFLFLKPHLEVLQ